MSTTIPSRLHSFMTRALIQAQAIILLCSVYALRNGEVTRLRLEDIDWRKETLTIRRCKGSRIQQFPLQFEVGEAILRYLQVRPRCTCRNVFVTQRLPHYPILRTTLGQIVTERMQQLRIVVDRFGPHGLRHACATHFCLFWLVWHNMESVTYIPSAKGRRTNPSAPTILFSDLQLISGLSTAM